MHPAYYMVIWLAASIPDKHCVDSLAETIDALNIMLS